MSRQEIMRRAKEVLSSRRENSISTYEAHTEWANAHVPAFRETDRLLALTGSRILGVVMGQENGATVDGIKAEYESIADKRRQLLVNCGMPANYCDIKYTCEKCADTGYVGIDMCSCLKKEVIKASLEESGLYSLVENQSFSTFSLDYYEKDDKIMVTQNLKLLKNFADTFVPGKSDSFLFIGATGLGKTHLSSAVARAVIETGAYVVYDTALNLFGEFEMRRFGTNPFSSEESDIDRYTDCDLLIIDDLGCEVTNQFTVACLYNIINSRIIKHKSTIISTNLSQAELRKRYSDRIISRVFGEFKPLLFRGRDIREQKIK